MVKRYKMGIMENGSSRDYYLRLMESPKGDLIRYADHQAAVAEKDKEIERLKQWNNFDTGMRMDKYNELMQRAVRFAELLRMYTFDHTGKDVRYPEAKAFLARPDVVAWRKQEEEHD